MCIQWVLLENINVCLLSFYRSDNFGQFKFYQVILLFDYWVSSFIMGIKLDIYLILYFLVLNFFLVNLSLNLYKVYDIFIVMFRFFCGYFMI